MFAASVALCTPARDTLLQLPNIRDPSHSEEAYSRECTSQRGHKSKPTFQNSKYVKHPRRYNITLKLGTPSRHVQLYAAESHLQVNDDDFCVSASFASKFDGKHGQGVSPDYVDYILGICQGASVGVAGLPMYTLRALAHRPWVPPDRGPPIGFNARTSLIGQTRATGPRQF